MDSVIRKTGGGDGFPLTVDEMLAALRVDSTDDSPIVERCYRSAAAFIERQTPFVIVQADFEAMFPGWSDNCNRGIARYEIRRAPLRNVQAVKYLDKNYDWQDADLDAFLISERDRSFLVDAKCSFTPPALAHARDSVKILFSAGFDGDEVESGDDRVIDDGVAGILHGMAAHFYKNRELLDADNLAKVESGLGSLLGAYRDFY